jgi:hypothetical protein
MKATDKIKVGGSLPRIASVKALPKWRVEVVWANRDSKSPIVVDLAPMVFAYKVYKPLRDDRALFETVHVAHDGGALAWGSDDSTDMAAWTVERLAQEAMQPEDFAAFLKRTALSLDAAAAQLGISRRLVAYYASEREIPRYIALACAQLERLLGAETTVQEGRESRELAESKNQFADIIRDLEHAHARSGPQQSRWAVVQKEITPKPHLAPDQFGSEWSGPGQYNRH